MSVTRGREAAFFFSNYRIRVLRFLYGTLLSAYLKPTISLNAPYMIKQAVILHSLFYTELY